MIASRSTRTSGLTTASSTPCLLNDAESLLASSEADFFQKQVAAAAHVAKASEAATGCREGLCPDGCVTLKCVVVGDHCVGKTTLLSRYVLNEFLEDHKPTVLDNYAVQLNVNNRPIQLSIMDTAGLVDFRTIRQLSYNHVSIFLLCFSVVQPQSLQNVLEVWLPEVRKHCPNAPILLVGTQLDLRSELTVFRQLLEREEQPVWPERGRKWVKVLKLAGYFECSAKTGNGMKEVFDEAIWIGLKRHKHSKGWLSEKSSRKVERRHSEISSDDDTRHVTCMGPVGGSGGRGRNVARMVNSTATTSSGDSSTSAFSGCSADSAGIVIGPSMGSFSSGGGGGGGDGGAHGGRGVVRRIARIFSRGSAGHNSLA
ncbi:rho-related GTP-binding protein RhoJ-like [Sycon ciliatum]|uniref:rho-related GTP-binding protein RhoJ-like n=1 Tax=Sycon ciliatum TaxID=27933 RepID=UPI0031F61D2D